MIYQSDGGRGSRYPRIRMVRYGDHSVAINPHFRGRRRRANERNRATESRHREETAAEKRGCYGIAENIVVTLDGSKMARSWTLLSRVLNFASASGRDHWVKDDEQRLFARPTLRPMLFTLESYFCVSWEPTGSRSTRLRFLDARLEFGLRRTGRSVLLASWEWKR